MHLFTSAFLHVKQLLLLNTNSIKRSDFSNRHNLCHSNSFLEIDCSSIVTFHQMVVSNEPISEDMAFSLRNIEEHKYIGKRVYTIERMILNIWNTNSRRIVQIADYPQELSRQGQMFPDTCEHM